MSINNGTINPPSNTINGHAYVDLGHGMLWAMCNVGAITAFDSGDYFSWGETTAKPIYSDRNCTTMDKEMEDITGDAKYDATTANWGEPWRMPTKEEFEELIIECHWDWTYKDNGYEITGPTGRSIFLPANGLCNGQGLKDVRERLEYWSASPHKDFTMAAYSLVSYTAGREDIKIVRHSRRSEGRCIRPVADRV